jgi:PTS hybrid protein
MSLEPETLKSLVRAAAEQVIASAPGGNQDGGLGTNVSLIIDAINNAWSPKGVAVLVDLGGAETNSEMAVEMLQPEQRNLVVVCNAPIVEGAVMAATEAAGGSSLDQVGAVAEELSAS